MWGCHLADYAISVMVESQKSKVKSQKSKVKRFSTEGTEVGTQRARRRPGECLVGVKGVRGSE